MIKLALVYENGSVNNLVSSMSYEDVQNLFIGGPSIFVLPAVDLKEPSKKMSAIVYTARLDQVLLMEMNDTDVKRVEFDAHGNAKKP